MTGWIKLHRSLLEWGWYDCPNTRTVFIHLLLTVNHDPRPWHNLVIQPGQRIVGIGKLAKEIGITYQQARTALDKLKSTNEITTKTEGNYTLITITNWASFQDCNERINEPSTNRQRTDNDNIRMKEGKKDLHKPLDLGGDKSPPKKSIRKVSTRLDPEWQLPQDWGEWAESMGLTRVEIIEQARTMHDWAKAKDERKADWQATWRNWIRRYIATKGRNQR